MPRPLAWGLFLALVLLSVAIPAAAQTLPEEPTTLSVSDRSNERRANAGRNDRAVAVVHYSEHEREVVTSSRSTLIGVEEVSKRFTEGFAHV